MIGTIIGTIIAGETLDQTGATASTGMQILKLSGIIIDRIPLVGYIDING